MNVLAAAIVERATGSEFDKNPHADRLQPPHEPPCVAVAVAGLYRCLID